jgi:hypothetical protein
LAVLVAATDAVGLDLVLRTYPGRGPGLRDTGQLTIARRIAAMAHPSWRVALEEPAGDHGEAIDQVFWGADTIVAVEIERMLLDFQAQYRRASIKRDWLAARHTRPVRLVLAVEDTRRNRAAVAPHLTLIHTVLLVGPRQALAALRTGTDLGGDALCWIRRR